MQSNQVENQKKEFAEIVHHPHFNESETISAFCHGNARGLGAMAAYMAGNGTLNGKQLLTRSSWDALHANPVIAPLLSGIGRSNFTQGGINVFSLDRGLDTTTNEPRLNFPTLKASYLNAHGMRMGYSGWMGFGGSIM